MVAENVPTLKLTASFRGSIPSLSEPAKNLEINLKVCWFGWGSSLILVSALNALKGTPLHFPAVPALKMDWISASERARPTNSSTSSIPPFRKNSRTSTDPGVSLGLPR